MWSNWNVDGLYSADNFSLINYILLNFIVSATLPWWIPTPPPSAYSLSIIMHTTYHVTFWFLGRYILFSQIISKTKNCKPINKANLKSIFARDLDIVCRSLRKNTKAKEFVIQKLYLANKSNEDFDKIHNRGKVKYVYMYTCLNFVLVLFLFIQLEASHNED